MRPATGKRRFGEPISEQPPSLPARVIGRITLLVVGALCGYLATRMVWPSAVVLSTVDGAPGSGIVIVPIMALYLCAFVFLVMGLRPRAKPGRRDRGMELVDKVMYWVGDRLRKDWW